MLEIIARSSSISQRDLANHSGLSLGMVNLVLKRLVKTGYVQIGLLDNRKMRYFLTPQGIAAKSRRAYEYLSRTIRVYETYRSGINQIIEDQLKKGHRKFVIYGDGDIVDLVKMVLNQRNGTIQYRVCPPKQKLILQANETPLNCTLSDKTPIDGISILETILSNLSVMDSRLTHLDSESAVKA